MREDVRLRVSHVPDLQSGAVATGPLTVICPGCGRTPLCCFSALYRHIDNQQIVDLTSVLIVNKPSSTWILP